MVMRYLVLVNSWTYVFHDLRGTPYVTKVSLVVDTPTSVAKWVRREEHLSSSSSRLADQNRSRWRNYF